MQADESRRMSARAAADAASDEYDRIADSSTSEDSNGASPPDAIVDILKNRPYFVATMVPISSLLLHCVYKRSKAQSGKIVSNLQHSYTALQSLRVVVRSHSYMAIAK